MLRMKNPIARSKQPEPDVHDALKAKWHELIGLRHSTLSQVIELESAGVKLQEPDSVKADQHEERVTALLNGTGKFFGMPKQPSRHNELFELHEQLRAIDTAKQLVGQKLAVEDAKRADRAMAEALADGTLNALQRRQVLAVAELRRANAEIEKAHAKTGIRLPL